MRTVNKKNRTTAFTVALLMNAVCIGSTMQGAGLSAMAAHTSGDMSATQTYGNPAVSSSAIGGVHAYEYPVEVYAAGEKIATVSAEDFTAGKYTIPDYDATKNYYLRVGLGMQESGELEHCEYYRLSSGSEDWLYLFSTEEVPFNMVTVDLPLFDETGGYTVTFKDEVIYEVLEADRNFAGSYMLDYSTVDATSYMVNFKYADRTEHYRLMGMFWEYAGSTAAEQTAPTEPTTPTEPDDKYAGFVNIVVTASAGDVIMISQTDGTYSDTYTIKDEDVNGYAVVPLPDGAFHLVNTTKSIFADVVVDSTGKKEGSIGKDSVDNDDPTYTLVTNLSDPEFFGSYVLTSPAGDLIETGFTNMGAFELLDKIDFTVADLSKYGVYVYYSMQQGIANSTKPEDAMVSSEGYLFEMDGKLRRNASNRIKKGDLNGDGEVTVADVVVMQKYLLNVESINVTQVINGDLYADGHVDVFDLVFLKRMVLGM